MSPKLLNTLLLLGTFFMYYAFIGPLYSGEGGIYSFGEGVNTLKNKKAEYVAAEAEAEKLLNDAKTKTEAYKKISDDDKAKMKIMLPTSIDNIRLLHELSMLSVTTGLSFNGLNVSSNGLVDGKNAVGIVFSVKTTYPKFKELIDTLEKSMRIFVIKSVTFNAPDQDSGLSEYNIALETYYLK